MELGWCCIQVFYLFMNFLSFRIGRRSADHTAVSTQAGLWSTNAGNHKDSSTVDLLNLIDL